MTVRPAPDRTRPRSWDPTSTVDAAGRLPVVAVGDLALDEQSLARRDVRRVLRRARLVLDLLRDAGLAGHVRVSLIGDRVPAFGFCPLYLDVTGAGGSWRLEVQSNARGHAALGDRFGALLRIRDREGRTARADVVLRLDEPIDVVRAFDRALSDIAALNLPGGGRVDVDRFAPGGPQARVWTDVRPLGRVDVLVAAGEAVLLSAGEGARRIEAAGPLGADLAARWAEVTAGTDLVATLAGIPDQVLSNSDELRAQVASSAVRT